MGRCYIIECLACGRLEEVTRSDAVCCSPTCRVTLKRHNERRAELKARMARVELDAPIGLWLQHAAYFRLFPDCDNALASGELEHPTRRDVMSDEARKDCVQELRRQIMLSPTGPTDVVSGPPTGG